MLNKIVLSCYYQNYNERDSQSAPVYFQSTHLVFPSSNDFDAARAGYTFKAVSDLASAKSCPRILCATQTHVASDSKSSVHVDEILIVKKMSKTQIMKKRVLKVFSLVTKEYKTLQVRRMVEVWLLFFFCLFVFVIFLVGVGVGDCSFTVLWGDTSIDNFRRTSVHLECVPVPCTAYLVELIRVAAFKIFCDLGNKKNRSVIPYFVDEQVAFLSTFPREIN